MRGIILLFITTSILGGCSYFNEKLGFDDDHFLEELTEDYIQKQIDMDIDLTPFTPERV